MTNAAPFIAAIAAQFAIAPPAVTAAADPCRPVSGLISAEAGRLVPTLKGLRIRGSGSSEGGLSGDVVLEVLKPLLGSEAHVQFTIADATGPLVARGRAAFSADPDNHDVFHIRSDLQIADAGRGGAYRGSVTGVGRVDRRARTIAVAYRGNICDQPAVSTLASAQHKRGAR